MRCTKNSCDVNNNRSVQDTSAARTIASSLVVTHILLICSTCASKVAASEPRCTGAFNTLLTPFLLLSMSSEFELPFNISNSLTHICLRTENKVTIRRTEPRGWRGRRTNLTNRRVRAQQGKSATNVPRTRSAIGGRPVER